MLPVALDLATYVAAAPSADGKLRIYSEDRKEMREFDASRPRRARSRRATGPITPSAWRSELVRAGFPIEPANLLIRSTVPEGSGLSSSAALEVSSRAGVPARPRRSTPLDLAQALPARRARISSACPAASWTSTFPSSAASTRPSRSIAAAWSIATCALPDGVAFVAVNTMVKHALAGSAYQRARARNAPPRSRASSSRFPAVESLRDVTPEQFDRGRQPRCPPVVGAGARATW